jgi:phosphoserine phosphatase
VTSRLAIFDMDNTLLDRTGAVHRWATEFAAERAIDPADVVWIINADGDGFVSRADFATALRERYGLIESVDAMVGRTAPGSSSSWIRSRAWPPATPPGARAAGGGL